MTAQEALKVALKEQLAPALRSQGYKGSAPTWRLTNNLGDVAVVNVQSSSFSSSSELRCIINLAVAPKPWLDWSQAKSGKSIKSVKESDGLWRDRLHPTDVRVMRGGEPWWGISDAPSARLAAADMVEQLQVSGLPTLQRLLNRQAFLQTLRDGDLGFAKSSSLPTFFDWAMAVLLADEPPSDELVERLASLGSSTEPRHAEQGQRLENWVRERQLARSAGRR